MGCWGCPAIASPVAGGCWCRGRDRPEACRSRPHRRDSCRSRPSPSAGCQPSNHCSEPCWEERCIISISIAYYVIQLLNGILGNRKFYYWDVIKITITRAKYNIYFHSILYLDTCNIGFLWGGYKEILSHRAPIFPCIVRKKEIQHYYLDHPCKIHTINSLSQHKNPLKIMAMGVSFQRFTRALLDAHDVVNNRIWVVLNNAIMCVSALVRREWAWF